MPYRSLNSQLTDDSPVKTVLLMCSQELSFILSPLIFIIPTKQILLSLCVWLRDIKLTKLQQPTKLWQLMKAQEHMMLEHQFQGRSQQVARQPRSGLNCYNIPFDLRKIYAIFLPIRWKQHIHPISKVSGSKKSSNR